MGQADVSVLPAKKVEIGGGVIGLRISATRSFWRSKAQAQSQPHRNKRLPEYTRRTIL